MLGQFVGMTEVAGGKVTTQQRELIDWIIVQLNPEAHTYFNDKDTLIAKKLNELEGQ